MKPILSMLILGAAALPMAIFIALLLWALRAPWELQLGVICFAVLDGMFEAALCWAAREN